MEVTSDKLLPAVVSSTQWLNLSELYKPRTIKQLKQKLSNVDIGESIYSKVNVQIDCFIGDTCLQ